MNVRIIAILSDSLSHLDAFSPNAFDHNLHIFICLIVSVVLHPSTVVDKQVNTHLLTDDLIFVHR